MNYTGLIPIFHERTIKSRPKNEGDAIVPTSLAIAKMKDAISLGVGEPDFDTPGTSARPAFTRSKILFLFLVSAWREVIGVVAGCKGGS